MGRAGEERDFDPRNERAREQEQSEIRCELGSGEAPACPARASMSFWPRGCFSLTDAVIHCCSYNDAAPKLLTNAGTSRNWRVSVAASALAVHWPWAPLRNLARHLEGRSVARTNTASAARHATTQAKACFTDLHHGPRHYGLDVAIQVHQYPAWMNVWRAANHRKLQRPQNY